MTADPLGYPGAPVSGDGTVVDGEFRAGAVGDLSGRRPVLAVGSNASLPVLRSKLSDLPLPVDVPVTTVIVHNIVVGVSAHVSRPGYLPATPVEAPGARTPLVACWFDAQQLAAIDATEPNYDRVRLPANRFAVDADVYVSRRGYLFDNDGAPRRLVPQEELVAGLLTASVALQTLAGETPKAFVVTMQNPKARAQAADIFQAEGWVRPRGQFTTERTMGRTCSPK